MLRERTPRLVVAVVALLCVIVTGLATAAIQAQSRDRAAAWLETRATVVDSAIRQSLEDSASDLAALAGYLEARPDATQDEMVRFSNRLDLSPSVVASAFVRVVPRADLEAFVDEMQVQMPGFTLSDLQGVEYAAADVDREMVYPVQFLMPGPFLRSYAAADPAFEIENAFGFDASTEGAWGSAVDVASDRGKLTVSDFFVVSELAIGKAFVILDPVMRDGELYGIVGALALDRLLPLDVSFSDEVVWQLTSANGLPQSGPGFWSQDISFAGATWRLTVEPGEVAAAELAGFPLWAIFAAGLVLTLLLSAFAHEITQRSLDHRRIEALQKAAADKDRFLAAVSHEIRTPLTVVAGFSHELRDNGEYISAAEKEGLLYEIAGQADEMTAIIEDLLVAARTDIRNVSIHQASIDLRSEIEAAIPPMGGHQVQIGDDTATAFADPGRVRQIVRNLLTNARRYGGADVRIAITSERNSVRVEVSDDGQPVPEDRRETIFEPYTSAHQRNQDLGSIGLGLFISRELARLMGGDLEYHRRDRRTCFELTLPAGVTSQRLGAVSDTSRSAASQ